MGTVAAGCWLYMGSACRGLPVKQQLQDYLGPHICRIPFGNTCGVALALVLWRDPVYSDGSEELGCEISSGSAMGAGKLSMPRSIMVAYPTASAAVGFGSWEQSELFSSNEYHILPAYALIGLNSLSMALAGLYIPQGRRV